MRAKLSAMKIYSSDLRKRVVAAVREGEMSQAAIAHAFSVSLGTVENWWRSWRVTGRTAPLPHAGGNKRILQPYAAQIRHAVKQQPDATLQELCAAVEAATHVATTSSMMCRELQILHLPRKKVTARQSARDATRAMLAPSVSEKDSSSATADRRPAKIHR
jgi:transposase